MADAIDAGAPSGRGALGDPRVREVASASASPTDGPDNDSGLTPPQGVDGTCAVFCSDAFKEVGGTAPFDRERGALGAASPSAADRPAEDMRSGTSTGAGDPSPVPGSETSEEGKVDWSGDAGEAEPG
ncbi:MAG: hypothetical protein AAF559_11440 [Pseudomonadota bacterium]